jgi:hypothetical protein
VQCSDHAGRAQSLSQNQPEAHQIREIIDVEHIKSQLKEGSLDFTGCERLIDGIIAVVASVHDRMKEKERKEETLAKWKECQAVIEEANDKEQVSTATPACLACTHASLMHSAAALPCLRGPGGCGGSENWSEN